MSNVRTDLLSDRTGLKPPGVTKADFVKVWLYLNQSGASPVVNASLDVSSIVDIGVGNTPANLTAAFSSSNYAVSGIAYPVISNFDLVHGGPASASQIALWGTSVIANATARADTYAQIQAVGVLA